MSEHTPLPWRLEQKWHWVVGPNGESIARIRRLDERPANAEFIVRACNSHDDLLAALERHEWFGTDWDTWRCGCCSAEFQDGEERHHDDSCPTAVAIAKAKLPT